MSTDILNILKQDRFDLVIEHLQTQKGNLKETFEVFTKQQSTQFWNVILSNVRGLMATISTQCDSSGDDDEYLDSNLSTMKCVIHAVSAFSLVSKFKPSSIYDIIMLSQSVLMCNKSLSSLTSLKSSISKLSELWWLNNEEGAENLMPQLITFLLMSTLGMDGYDMDIKRLYALRGAFHLLDFEDHSISFIRDLIQRSFVHPSYLRVKEGQKLLSFLLNVDKGHLIDLVAAVIRPQLATGTKTVAAVYGKIFYHAWMESQSLEDKDEISRGGEDQDGLLYGSAQALEDTIQNFLREGIHAAEDKYFKGVRFMLQSLHDVQRNKLDAMLLRVYDPILWRSLRCANAQVRAQAAVVFLDVFPLQHADGRAEDNDKILQKQFDLLAALLTDSDQHVRAHAALGVCHILKEYWESLPLNTTHNILKFLIDTLSVDASCANVRHAVFVGIGELFQQPLTHGLLKQLLPLLRNSIHDKSEKVRVAFLKILCQVKGIRGMHFYDIVPVDHLLARMAADRELPAVCSAMTELMLNSFYPSEAAANVSPETEQLNRCLQFIAKNAPAAEVFYSYLHHFISIGQAAKLITVMFTFLVTAEARSRAVTADSGEDAEEPANGKRRRIPKVSQKQLGFTEKLGLMRILVKLLESVSADLAVQHPSRDLVAKYLTEEHTRALLHACAKCDSAESVHLLPAGVHLVAYAVSIRKMGAASNSKAKSASFDLQSLLADAYVPVYLAAAELDQESMQKSRSALASAFVDVFCSAEQEASLLAALVCSCEASFGALAKPTKKSSAKSAHSTALPFGAAMALFSAFSPTQLAKKSLTNTLSDIFQMARARAETLLQGGGGGGEDEEEGVMRFLQVWMSFCLHQDARTALQNEENAEIPHPLIQELLDWTTAQLVPHVCREDHNPLSCRLLCMVCAMLSDLFYLDLHDEAVCLCLRDWLRLLSSRGRDHPTAFVRDTSLLLPSILRITSLLSLGKEQPEFHVDELSVAILNVLLKRMDLSVEEGEGTAVLSILNAVSLAEASAQAALVRLVDEMESISGANNKPHAAAAFAMPHAPKSSSGKFLAAAMIEVTADAAHVGRAQRILLSWQQNGAPFSVRNPTEMVSIEMVRILSDRLQSVHALDRGSAPNSMGKTPQSRSRETRTENSASDGNQVLVENASMWAEI